MSRKGETRPLRNIQYHVARQLRKKVCDKLALYQQLIDKEYLTQGITNSEVIYSAIVKLGYGGGLIIKDYVRDHKDLVPAKRVLAIEAPNRGRRYETSPGEMFQMDWGFVNVADDLGNEWQCSCFVMVCHHCGLMYIELFKSAR